MSNNYTLSRVKVQPQILPSQEQNEATLSLSIIVPKNAACPEKKGDSLGAWLEQNTVITHLEVRKKDVRVKRKRIDNNCNKKVTRRAKICMFSRKQLLSLNDLIRNTDKKFSSFITLTYPTDYPTNGKEVKGHRDKLLKRLGRQYGKFSYLWLLEWQKRGAPHVHIATSIDLTAVGEVATFGRLDKAGRSVAYQTNQTSETGLASHWFEVTGGEGRVSFEVVKSHDRLARYMVKSLDSSQKIIPYDYHHAGAFWGASHDMRGKPQIIEPSGKVLARVRELPRVVKAGYIPTTLYGASEVILDSLDTLI